MSDIVGRLRAWADPVEQGYEVPAAGQVMRSAADEIERLREALRAIAHHSRASSTVIKIAREALGDD